MVPAGDLLAVAVRAVGAEMLAVRRHLHTYPDLSGQEQATVEFLAERLRSRGLALRVGCADTALLVQIEGTGPIVSETARSLLIRADIDALPIQEADDGREVRSLKPGVMHACGHDTHAAIAIGVAEVLARHRELFHGRVSVLFQPAEETISGAQRVLDEGLVVPGSFDAVLGLHVLSQLPVGVIAVRAGAIYGSSDEIQIEIIGRAGHGGLPHAARDPIPVAAAIISQIQTIITREISPLNVAIISFGQIHGGNATNAIAERVTLYGTVRAFRTDVRDMLLHRIRGLACGIAQASRLEAHLNVGSSCPPVICDPGMVELVGQAAHDTVGAIAQQATQLSVADDVAHFTALAPGCYFMLGARDPAWELAPVHHHPEFKIDERSIALGAEVMLRAAIAYFNDERETRVGQPSEPVAAFADLDPTLPVAAHRHVENARSQALQGGV